jgi:hypothetical protein
MASAHSTSSGLDTAAVLQTGLFRSEYEQEMESWLRRRFGYLCMAYIGWDLLLLAVKIALLFMAPQEGALRGPYFIAHGIGIGEILLSLGVVSWFFVAGQKALVSRADVLRAAFHLILILGLISLAMRMIVDITAPGRSPNVVGALFFWHFTACLFLPWSPKDSLRPLVPLLVIWALYVLFSEAPGAPLPTVLKVLLTPLILMPGIAVCAWRLERHSHQFRSAMIGKHFLSMRREFSRARSVHESMFPPPYSDGCLRMEYVYTPMREIGGDFLHLHVGGQGSIHLTLLDVTGHGLPAALTVNRLYGEMERIRAESPRAEPGEVLRLINRYINLTMVRHNIYATAVCVSIDPYEGELTWANAGHPPAFLRGVNGAVKELQATAVVLGALGDDDFNPAQERYELAPGDALIMYTDGAFETRNAKGERFGLDRLRELARRQPSPQNWPRFMAAMIEKHTAGRIEDDVLIASVCFDGFRLPTKPVSQAVMQRS